jgi:hypothetical protein
MARTLLIDMDYIKDNSILDDNVDERLMVDALWTAQREYIKPILGTNLFDDIIAKAAAGTLAGNDLILVNMTPILAYKYRNKGVVQQNSENSQVTSFDDLNHLLNRWRDKAEMFAEDIINYLVANHTLFPLYTSNSDSDDIFPSNSAFTGGLYLGNGKNRGGGFDYLRDCCD